ncbi:MULTISPECIES: ABC transporter ATP-binding protein [Pseudoalteromonas]|jgi:ABC-2 type transport system ATP-binding protein|uniref:ABC transporter ATP-binding protein n=1 Tax=Pseudoalteromonas TaxID=53246 RepID=UPI00057D19FF|nr:MULTISPECIES: ABC transporter ATP-binding protein [Pseudoalteromonas]AUJ70454.1 SkfA peptide export ATP-binding protein SkfE [Pseudoalteromonas sp. NC201]KID33066.1 ABC transporter ATP-binding protein [Pseudoalteromonas flavipulchra NCIMB 2033 = ATCC BAA-314]MBD0781233.1 ABC transporter ATP-binding protein [Pseudoalteromonas flavipulchra]MBE0373400.1 ABC-2 type transport system ATP-binding protein [Pseudoalteromonas flavipulchra NCIMB 2033 = ATCC BAA-314]MBR8841517.1 ABC transporter ATP-bin
MTTPVIQINNLQKRFGEYQALQGLNLSVHQGEILALLGPNGAGKTTTINCLLGFLQPDAGEITIAGINPQHDVVTARQQLAYIPEQVALYPRLSGLENLAYFSKMASIEKTDEAFRTLLSEVKLPSHAVDKPVATYSKGMRQKVGIAIALAKQAKALILDEPTSGLDPSASHEFSQLIQSLAKQGVAILMATHDLYRAQEDAHRVAIINQGQLVDTLVYEQLQEVQLESVYLKHIKVGV